MSDMNTSQSDSRQYLTFILDGEEFGVPILTVNGIRSWEPATPLPNAPDYVLGVINLRGEVVPIIDLRKRFGLATVPHSSHTVVIIVHAGQAKTLQTVGLVVDAVADVHDIDRGQVHNTPDFWGKNTDNVVKSLGMIGDKMVMLLEMDNLADWSKVSTKTPVYVPDAAKAVESLAA